jgi:hypothetical protein
MKKFIEKAKKKHGDKYDYSLVDYLDCYTEIEIICKTHDIKITTTPTYHLKNNGYDCKECLKIFQLNFKKKNTNEFVENSIKIHGDKYDYSLVEYKTSKDKVKIICKIHDIFEQLPDNHLQGSGCVLCSGTYLSNTNEFIEKGDNAEQVAFNILNLINFSKIELISIDEDYFITI